MQQKRPKHALVVKMFAAITVCFVVTNIGLNVVFAFGLDDQCMYLAFANNFNSLIYYWPNKEFRGEHNDFWREAGKKL